MKVIIAGSRTITDFFVVQKAIEKSVLNITEVVSGCAKGVDKLGEMWADQNNIPVKRFPAKWEVYGKKAGSIRNREMSEYGDALIACWNLESPGTQDMITKMRELGKFVYVHIVVDHKRKEE